VIGTAAAASGLETLARLRLAGAGFAGLDLCRLEPFRIAGTERFAVRWLDGGHGPVGSLDQAPPRAASATTGFVVEPCHQDHWESIVRLCKRLDPAVVLDGDRFWRRITWQGRFLGQVVSAEGSLQAIEGDGTRRPLLTAADVRGFCDLLVRRYAVFAGLVSPAGRSPVATANARDDGGATARDQGGAIGRATRPAAGDSLRSSLAAARLSPEEYSALGGLDRPGSARSDASGEAAGVGDDEARIVAARDGSWASPPERLG